MEQQEFDKEKKKLEEILEKYKEVMKYYNLRMEAIPKLYKQDTVMLENMINMYAQKLCLMEKSVKNPYFARLDFVRDGEKKVEKLYIGKVGVMDEENNSITIDWRAPISSMYYDSNLGRASYEAPEGTCTGELLVKRQYEIENGELQSYQDVDTVSNDELLKPYLGANADSRLKNIVSTIQTEQNEIIREPLNKNIIVQGVAGSGKTTVALHRIAYLVYNNRNRINPEQYLVIGPNKFFVSYISGVLPDLDVNNVSQLTYLELCSNFIGEKLELINEEEKLIKSISNDQELAYERLKVSMRYKEVLDEFINQLDKSIIPDKGITLKGMEIIPSNLIKEIYNSISTNEIYNTIHKKTQRTKLLLEKYIEDNYDEIAKEIKKNYTDERKFRKDIEGEVKKYFKNLIPPILKLYEKFLKNLEKDVNKIYQWNNLESIENNSYEDKVIYLKKNWYACNSENIIDRQQGNNQNIGGENNTKTIKEKIEKNVKNVKGKKVDFEDLSALVYLKCKVIGTEKYATYRQVAVDEAQDFGDFSFYALKVLLENATFSIFGDVAQSIYQYRGINKWADVVEETFANDCELKYLKKSYRTTAEIMNEANKVITHIGLDAAMPVIRHGEKVKYIPYNNLENQVDIITNAIKEYKQKGFNSIAVICKSEKEANQINDALAKHDIIAKNITNSDTEYDGGICTITSYLAKGLEFDGAIISDASEGSYNPNKAIDMKLLYVAMTRPLHELRVLEQN